ncbi:MAG TPA: hypothetical protein VIF34_04830 [Methylocystis sp.]
MIFRGGVMRWYVRGKEATRAVNMLFYENKWPIPKSLDTARKARPLRGDFSDVKIKLPFRKNLLRKGMISDPLG